MENIKENLNGQQVKDAFNGQQVKDAFNDQQVKDAFNDQQVKDAFNDQQVKDAFNDQQVKDAFNDQQFLPQDLMEEMALADMMPGMSLAAPPPPQEPCIVEDQVLLNLYDEILINCREDRKKAEDLSVTFADMVVNDGDASSASKEALVNLVKIKSDIGDKMAKVADLMTRIKLKDKDTFPRYLAAHQHNQVTIETSKRDILKSLQQAQRKKK